MSHVLVIILYCPKYQRSIPSGVGYKRRNQGLRSQLVELTTVPLITLNYLQSINLWARMLIQLSFFVNRFDIDNILSILVRYCSQFNGFVVDSRIIYNQMYGTDIISLIQVKQVIDATWVLVHTNSDIEEKPEQVKCAYMLRLWLSGASGA